MVLGRECHPGTRLHHDTIAKFRGQVPARFGWSCAGAVPSGERQNPTIYNGVCAGPTSYGRGGSRRHAAMRQCLPWARCEWSCAGPCGRGASRRGSGTYSRSGWCCAGPGPLGERQITTACCDVSAQSIICTLGGRREEEEGRKEEGGTVLFSKQVPNHRRFGKNTKQT